jgi:hypothetical protein
LKTAREAAGNWKSFDSFDWFAEPEDEPESWAIVYTHNRDSGIADRCNAEVIAEALAGFDEDVKPESHGHFLCGWIDGFAIRVYRNGEITEAFKRYHELTARLDDCACLDEMRLSEMEAEESAEGWNDWARRDYLRALCKRFGAEERDTIKPEDVKTVFDSAASDASICWIQDSGSMYIDVDRVAGATSIDDALPFVDTALPSESARVVAGLLAELVRRPEAGNIIAGANLGGAQSWALADEIESELFHPQSAADLSALLWSLNARPDVCRLVCESAGVSADQFSFAIDELDFIARILDR